MWNLTIRDIVGTRSGTNILDITRSVSCRDRSDKSCAMLIMFMLFSDIWVSLGVTQR